MLDFIKSVRNLISDMNGSKNSGYLKKKKRNATANIFSINNKDKIANSPACYKTMRVERFCPPTRCPGSKPFGLKPRMVTRSTSYECLNIAADFFFFFFFGERPLQKRSIRKMIYVFLYKVDSEKILR